MAGVVHVICASLRPDTDAASVDRAVDLGHGLRAADGAEYVSIGCSERALVAATWLRDRDSLEPFAASTAHMSFVMRGLAPCITGMWSAAVDTDAALPATPEHMWAFALGDAETLYEWQVRDLVRDIEALPGVAAAGVTIEERERYRAGGVVCLAGDELWEFRDALPRAMAAWNDVGRLLMHELVSVVDRPGVEPGG